MAAGAVAGAVPGAPRSRTERAFIGAYWDSRDVSPIGTVMVMRVHGRDDNPLLHSSSANVVLNGMTRGLQDRPLDAMTPSPWPGRAGHRSSVTERPDSCPNSGGLVMSSTRGSSGGNQGPEPSRFLRVRWAVTTDEEVPHGRRGDS